MKDILTLLLLFVSLTISAQSLDGTWKGKLKAGPQTLTIVYHIALAKKTVTMDVVEQGASSIQETIAPEVLSDIAVWINNGK
ncbi:MAG: hypothetical protein ACI4T9_01395 [Prevotella sp.]